MTLLEKAYPVWSRAVLANQPGWLTAAITVRPKSSISVGQISQQFHHRLDTMHNQIHHRLDTAQSVSTARIETLMLENSRRSDENSRRFDLLLVGMSSRLDKVLGVVITVVLAGFGFLHQKMDRKIDQTDGKIESLKEEMDRKIDAGNAQMDRKIDAGNAQLKEEMNRKIDAGNSQMDRKIDAGNAQLKVDLVKALKWNLPFVS